MPNLGAAGDPSNVRVMGVNWSSARIYRIYDPAHKLERIPTHTSSATMAEDSSSQIFDPRKYLDHFYSYLNKKPGEEPEVLEFILTKLHEYMKEGE